MSDEISTVDDDREFEEAFNELTDSESEENATLEEVEESSEPLEEAAEENKTDEEADEKTEQEFQQSWDDVPEALRNEFYQVRSKNEELEHSLKSNNGRVSALQKKINELELSGNQEEKAPEQADESNSRLEELREDYPEFAEMIDLVVRQNNEQSQQHVMQQVEERITPLQQIEQQRYNEYQVSLLADEFPDWQAQEQSEGFATWIEQQPPVVQQLIQSRQAEDHAYLLRGYNQTRTDKVASITEKRERKLASSEALPNKGPSKKAIAPDDFEAAFNYYVNKG